MVNGTKTGNVTDNKGKIKFFIKWSSIPNNDGNYSDVTVTSYWAPLSGYDHWDFDTAGSRNASITIDGVKSSISKRFDTGNNWSNGNPYKIQSYTRRIYHNSDGTKSITISARANGRASDGTTSYGPSNSSNSSGDCTVDEVIIPLDTIPRASVLDSVSCSTKYFDGLLTYKYTPQSGDFYNRCVISLNMNGALTTIKTIDLGQKSASQQTGSLTLLSDDLSIIYNNMPKNTEGILRFTLKTYSDDSYQTQIGDAVNKETGKLEIPIAVVPKLGTVSLSANITTSDGTSRNVLVKEKNKITVSVSGCSAGLGSSIKSYTFTAIHNSKTIETKTITSSSASASVSFGPFLQTGTISFKVSVADNRERSTSDTKAQTCFEYGLPSFKSFTAYRCNSIGDPDEKGTNIKYSLQTTFDSVNSTNNSTVKIYYKANTDSSWTAAANALTNSTVKSASAIVNNTSGSPITFNADVTYLIYAVVTDNYSGSNSSSIITIFGSSRIMNIRKSGNGIAFGKMSESDNLFECRWPAKFDDAVTIPDDGGCPVLNGYGVETLGPGEAIPSGSDLNTYTTPGVFSSASASVSGTLINTPITSCGFRLVVEYIGGSSYIRQTIISRTTKCKTYKRYKNTNSWYDWQVVLTDGNVADYTDGKFLPLSGGTLTGQLTLDGGPLILDETVRYTDNGKCGLDCMDSDIIKAHGIYFADAVTAAGEGINFYNSDGVWDTLFTSGGALKYHAGRGTSDALSGHKVITAGHIRRGTCTLSSSSDTTISFTTALGGTPTVMLTPLTSTGGVIPGKVKSASSTGFTAIIGGSAVSSAQFAYLAVYY